MASTYEPIASQTLSSAATSVSFTSIPSTFTDIIILSHEPSASTTNSCYLRFNNDSGSNYSDTWIYGTGSSALSIRNSSKTGIFAGGSLANLVRQFHIMSYASTNVYKTSLLNYNSTISGNNSVVRSVGLWRSTSAIDRIDLVQVTSPGFASGSTFSLYGIKAA